MSYTIRMVAVAMLAMLVGCGQGKEATTAATDGTDKGRGEREC